MLVVELGVLLVRFLGLFDRFRWLLELSREAFLGVYPGFAFLVIFIFSLTLKAF